MELRRRPSPVPVPPEPRGAPGRRTFLAAAAALGLVAAGSLVAVHRLTAWPPPGRDGPAGDAPPVPRPPRAEPAPTPLAAALPAARAGAPSRPGSPAVAAPPTAPPPPREPAGGTAPRIELAFKLDSRLTHGLAMGDRWVSPATYSGAGDATSASVEARARLRDGAGAVVAGTPTWSASEPDMVEVSPEEGDRVRITVWRAGESSLTVSAGGTSRTLAVRAAPAGGALRMDIVQ